MERESANVVCFGEILWDVLPSGEKPGGAPMNVAYHLHKLGMKPALISRVGADEHGAKLMDLLRVWGLSTAYIQEDSGYQTGVVKASIGQNHEVSYDIIHPVAWDFIAWSEELQWLVSKAAFFVHGSLGSRSDNSRQTLLRLREAASFKVLDINLRTPHYSKALVEELLKGTDMLKLNEHELPLITGWFGKYSVTEDALHLLQEKFRIPTIIVTMGGSGAVVNAEGSIYRHPGYKIHVADTVGSGDAFLAGFISRFHQGEAIGDCLRFANKLGAYTATREGACPDYSIEDLGQMV